MHCQHCGNKLVENSKFCGKCGKNISQPVLTEILDSNSTKKITRWQKIQAGFIGWIGGGVVWYVFGIIGWTNADNHIIGMLIALFVTIFIWVKLYRYYVDKWTKELKIIQKK